jgi:hypothetical protein
MLLTVDEVKELISQGQRLSLAGDEEILKQLPKGKWIAGTIPYFMADEGGLSTREKVFVTQLPDYIIDAQIVSYTKATIPKVFSDAPADGFSLIIIPASSDIHLSFALNAPKYDAFATRPLIGWISGMHLDDLGKISAKVVNGETGEFFEDTAVVMHATLPEDKYADIGIINIFKQGDGETIQFLEDGFVHAEALINGEKQNLAEYIAEKKLDIRLPLVADYFGAMINVSFQKIDEESDPKTVHFYAPVFQGQQYRQAQEVEDYVSDFMGHVPADSENITFSCNCILNYLYSELEGKQTGRFIGPMTFGEVAYQLINQTLAYLSIHDVVYEEETEYE